MPPQRLARGIATVLYCTVGPFAFNSPITQASRINMAACSLAKAAASCGSLGSSTWYFWTASM